MIGCVGLVLLCLARETQQCIENRAYDVLLVSQKMIFLVFGNQSGSPTSDFLSGKTTNGR